MGLEHVPCAEGGVRGVEVSEPHMPSSVVEEVFNTVKELGVYTH